MSQRCFEADEPSKLNTPLDVPTTLAAVSPTVPTMPLPRVPMHAADVAVVQLVVLQSASARTAVTETSVGAKIMPVSVTLAAADATLYGAAAEITGANELRLSTGQPKALASISPAGVATKVREVKLSWPINRRS